jgi:hypothetical protein
VDFLAAHGRTASIVDRLYRVEAPLADLAAACENEERKESIFKSGPGATDSSGAALRAAGRIAAQQRSHHDANPQRQRYHGHPDGDLENDFHLAPKQRILRPQWAS